MGNRTYTIYRGDSFSGTVALRISDPLLGTQQPYPIPTGSVVAMYWPGNPSVTLSTANPGEITYLVQSDGTFGYKGSPAKSAQFLKGNNLAVDVVVTTPSEDQYTFEAVQILNIKDRANP